MSRSAGNGSRTTKHSLLLISLFSLSLSWFSLLSLSLLILSPLSLSLRIQKTEKFSSVSKIHSFLITQHFSNRPTRCFCFLFFFFLSLFSSLYESNRNIVNYCWVWYPTDSNKVDIQFLSIHLCIKSVTDHSLSLSLSVFRSLFLSNFFLHFSLIIDHLFSHMKWTTQYVSFQTCLKSERRRGMNVQLGREKKEKEKKERTGKERKNKGRKKEKCVSLILSLQG